MTHDFPLSLRPVDARTSVKAARRTIRVYVISKGTPRFAEYRQIVPHRFAIVKTEYDK